MGANMRRNPATAKPAKRTVGPTRRKGPVPSDKPKEPEMSADEMPAGRMTGDNAALGMPTFDMGQSMPGAGMSGAASGGEMPSGAMDQPAGEAATGRRRTRPGRGCASQAASGSVAVARALSLPGLTSRPRRLEPVPMKRTGDESRGLAARAEETVVVRATIDPCPAAPRSRPPLTL